MDQKNYSDKTDADAVKQEPTLEKIVETECGCRLCRCGENHCEYAADFFTPVGEPKAQLGTDEDMLNQSDMEAAADYSAYAYRTGSDDFSPMSQSGEPVYHSTADYRMISRDDSAADSSKS